MVMVMVMVRTLDFFTGFYRLNIRSNILFFLKLEIDILFYYY